jgi:hypothetical protein
MRKSSWRAPSSLEVRAFVGSLAQLRAAVAGLDIRAHCFQFDRERFEQQVGARLQTWLDRARDLLREISARCDPPEPTALVLNDGLMLADPNLDEAFGVAPSSLFPLGVEQDLWRRVGDACFGAMHDISASGSLVHGHDHEDLLARADSMRRRLTRALAAVSRAIAEAGGDGCSLVPEASEELECSVAVRRAYARFRRSIPGADKDAPETVVQALRLTAVAFAVLFGALDRSELRLRDQRLLRSLQERLFDWARGTRDSLEGTRLLQDITATAELLRAINMRQELRAHDARLMQRALSTLPDVESLEAVRTWIGSLCALQGRDDHLDAELLEANHKDADPRERVEAIVRRLRQLHASESAQAGTLF